MPQNAPSPQSGPHLRLQMRAPAEQSRPLPHQRAASARRPFYCRCATHWWRRYCPIRCRANCPSPIIRARIMPKGIDPSRYPISAQTSRAVGCLNIGIMFSLQRVPPTHVPRTMPCMRAPSNGVFLDLDCSVVRSIRRAHPGQTRPDRQAHLRAAALRPAPEVGRVQRHAREQRGRSIMSA